MKNATTIRQEMIKIGKDWVKQKAKSLKKFPVLESGAKGLIVGGSLTHFYWKVLLPDGKLMWFSHGTYSPVKEVSDDHYTSEKTLTEIEKAIAKEQARLASNKILSKRLGLSFSRF